MSAAALARSSHPGPGLAVTIAATLIAVAAGRGPGAVVGVAVAVLVGQLAIGWANDGLDADRDRATGRSDKPVAAGLVSRRGVLLAAGVAAVASVPLSLLVSGVAGWCYVAFVVAGLLYDAGLKATAFSAVPYVVAFGLLPAFVVAPVGRVPWWLTAAGALLGAGAHLANALPDLDDDLATGVRGMPHRLGARWSAVGAAGLLGAASVVLAAGVGGGWLALGVLVATAAGLAVGTRFGGRAGLFRAVMAVALLDVVLLVVGGSALR